MFALPEIPIDRIILNAKHGYTYLKEEEKKKTFNKKFYSDVLRSTIILEHINLREFHL